ELLARQKTHPPMIEPRLDAVAVELDLVNPFAIPWWDAMQRGEARWHEIRKSNPPPLSDRRIRAAPRGDRHGCLCRCLCLWDPLRAAFCLAASFAACFWQPRGLCLDLSTEFGLALRPRRLLSSIGFPVAVPTPFLFFSRRDLIHGASAGNRQRLLFQDIAL